MERPLLTQVVSACPEPSQLSAQWIHDARSCAENQSSSEGYLQFRRTRAALYRCDRLSNFSSLDMGWTYAPEVPIRSRRAEVCTEAAILY